MTKKFWGTLGAVAGAVILLWFAFGHIKKEPATMRIGAIDPLTGPFASYGEPIRDGMLLAVEEINATGGINGKKIDLILEDDGGDPKTSVNAFTKLATISKVPVIIGPLSSATSMATAPLADRFHVVQVSTLAGTIDLTNAGDYVFRIYPSSELGSRYIAKIAADRFHARRAAVFYPNNAYGVASKKFVVDTLKGDGVSVLAVETFNDGDRDFRTQLIKIMQAKPDVILCGAYYEEGAQILVQAKQLGISVPILGEDGWFGPISRIAGDALKNLYFANISFGPEFKDNAPMQQFIGAYRARFKKQANSYAAAGYAAIYLVKHAIEVGAYDGTKIKEALYHTDLMTAFGRIKYDQNGDNIGATYNLFQLDANNEPVLVK